MSVLLSPYSDAPAWTAALTEALAEAVPDQHIDVWPDVTDDDAVEFLVAWKHAAEDLHRFPNLRAILVLGAGIDQFLAPEYPVVPVVRLADPVMADEMAQYAMHWVLHFQRQMPLLAQQQTEGVWKPVDYVQALEHRVGILGYGTIGRRIGDAARTLGFPVNAWSRTGADDDSVESFSGPDELDAFLAASDSIVNVLPNSSGTAHLMNAERFAACRPGSVFINIGRGATVDEVALVSALDAGTPGWAVLDVTDVEPLPTESPLWSHPQVRLTPHVAGATQKRSASRVVAANIARILRGEDPFPVLDRSRGY